MSDVADPDAFVALRNRMYVLRDRTERLAQEAQQIAQEVEDLSEELLLLAEPGVGSMKRPDGRLNDAGIRAINAAFANKMKVAEAAKAFGISPSAASTRRKLWEASQRASEQEQKVSGQDQGERE